jgi:hypothetical protein
VIARNPDGTYQWATYIDNVRVLTYPSVFQSTALGHQIGWEANLSSNSKATWTSPNFSDLHQVLISGSYQYWNTGARRDASSSPPRNNKNWKALFPLTSGVTDYTKGEYTRP